MALLINAVVWIPIFVSLFSGFGVLLFGPIFPALANLSGWFCDGSLWLIEHCIELAQRVPYNHVYAPPPPWWWVAIFYAMFLAWILIPQLKGRRLWASALLVVWLAIAVVLANNPQLALANNQTKPLTCTFVSVGHGTSVLIEYPNGTNMLYDAGKLGSPVGAARPISAVLWSRGITHLDAIVISHADADHFNGVPELLTKHSVGVIYVSPVMFDQTDQPAVVDLHAAIKKSGVPIQHLSAGDKLRVGDDTALEILHPPALGVIGNDNANSIVLLVAHAGRKVLLPGDLESPGLEDLLAELPIDTDVLMAPHHGSARSDPKGFANWCRPEHVIISGGRDVEDIDAINSVKRSYGQLGSDVYHTAEHGSVRMVITAEKAWAETFRKLKPE